MQQKRAKAIDVLITNVDSEQEVLFLELAEDPAYLVEWLTSNDDVRELQKDLASNCELVKDRNVQDFFRKYIILCQEKLDRQIKMSNPEWKSTVGTDRAIYEEIMSILGDKDLEELRELERDIRDKLNSDEPIDVEYWQTLLRELLVIKDKVSVASPPI